MFIFLYDESQYCPLSFVPGIYIRVRSYLYCFFFLLWSIPGRSSYIIFIIFCSATFSYTDSYTCRSYVRTYEYDIRGTSTYEYDTATLVYMYPPRGISYAVPHRVAAAAASSASSREEGLRLHHFTSSRYETNINMF